MKPQFYGEEDATVVLIQPTDEHEAALLPKEYELIQAACPDERVLLATFCVDSWNDDLSPWTAPPVFGKEGFGGKAIETLRYVQTEFFPIVAEKLVHPEKARRLIGGYSLAALFALFACYETNDFTACAAASPSVWFPNWADAYIRTHRMQAGTVYLSLGDRESQAKNQTMARVGSCIEQQAARLQADGVQHVLEWNAGGHFKDSEKRTARAFAWCIAHS